VRGIDATTVVATLAEMERTTEGGGR
jgi:hypothetical protein